MDWWSLGCVLYEMVCGLPPFWGDTIKDVYKKVIHSTPKFPAISPECQACMETLTLTTHLSPSTEPSASASPGCQACIEGLLQREPAARLGGRANGSDIKEHAFFQPMVWSELLEKKVTPPFES